ncbi:hypothetical protein LTR02_002577 [Friedmanniomyces endolithicus]|nr:hypothetical protein LTR94_007837 [Friedmanniomyces endolithicus]KAK0793115.1 hypothetical protein LTR59_008284 [Friedmanniomyces endolithicus]KAK0806148.1 hypothetical protein LTR75_007113 [Friedmanniomyces endolithicus]KAK0912969.1 hypothetical protein LTR02_002577 [Friedmanniomyces endolithicus]KAK0939024.1 hypothetical protein LTR29_009389 [Friedmanniomyces endolithicus]
MRTTSLLLPVSLLLLASTTTALQPPPPLLLQPQDYHPFLPALTLSNTTALPTPTQTPPPTNPNPLLAPRQNLISASTTNSIETACPTSYLPCASLGAPNLCCDSSAICSADYAGHVACCRVGAACSGTISQVITAGTVSDGVLVGAGGGAAAATSDNGGLVGASTVTTAAVGATTTAAGGSGFVLDGTSTVATPGFGSRRAEVPLVARAILKAMQYLPI